MNHRMVEADRDMWRPWSLTLLLKVWSSTTGCLGPCTARYSLPLRLEIPQPLWGTWPDVWPPLKKKKIFLMFRFNLLCFSLCPLPLVLSLGIWRYSRPVWTRSSVAYCRWPCFGRRVGLDDPQRSLPTPTILWFCDSVITAETLVWTVPALSVSSCMKGASVPYTSLWPFPQFSLLRSCLSFLYCLAQSRTGHSRCVYSTLGREEESPPSVCWYLFA